MNRLIAKAIDAWHDPLGFLGVQRERHQGSPVNYHHRQAQMAAAEAKLTTAIPAAVQSPVQEIPQWEDPPVWPDGTLLEPCLVCTGGLVERDGATYLCPSCNGMLFKEHGHAD